MSSDQEDANENYYSDDEQTFHRFVKTTVESPVLPNADNDDQEDPDYYAGGDKPEESDSDGEGGDDLREEFEACKEELVIPPEIVNEVAARFPPFWRMRQRLARLPERTSSNEAEDDQTEDPDFVLNEEDSSSEEEDEDEMQEDPEAEAAAVCEKMMDMELTEDAKENDLDEENMEQ